MTKASSRSAAAPGRGPSSSHQPRGRVRESALDNLRAAIISLEMSPGAALSENELAARLGVSRTPVRESLIILQSEGLVQVIPQVGSFVALVDPDRVAEAQFIREAIECSSLQSVVNPVGADDEEELAENLRLQRVCAAVYDPVTFFGLDEDFHRMLLRIAGHESAWRTVNSQKAHLDRARRLSLDRLHPLAALVAQHSRIADALIAGDRESAVTGLRAHLRQILGDVEAIRTACPELFNRAISPHTMCA